MNNLAISPYIAMYALQIQNVKRNTVKKASIQELNQEQSNDLNKEDLLPTNEVKDNLVPTLQKETENILPTSIDNNIGTEIN